MEKMHLATISILLKDRQQHAPDVNQLLTDNSHLILSRMGVNVQRHCIDHCTAIITVTLEANLEQIATLTEKLNSFDGIVAKTSLLTE